MFTCSFLSLLYGCFFVRLFLLLLLLLVKMRATTTIFIEIKDKLSLLMLIFLFHAHTTPATMDVVNEYQLQFIIIANRIKIRRRERNRPKIFNFDFGFSNFLFGVSLHFFFKYTFFLIKRWIFLSLLNVNILKHIISSIYGLQKVKVNQHVINSFDLKTINLNRIHFILSKKYLAKVHRKRERERNEWKSVYYSEYKQKLSICQKTAVE